jgi:hypothetical protein
LPSSDLSQGSLVKKIDESRPRDGALCIRVFGKGPRRAFAEKALRAVGLLMFLALAGVAWRVGTVRNWWLSAQAALNSAWSAHAGRSSTSKMRVTDEPTDVSVEAAVKLRRVRLLVTIVLIGTVVSIGFHYVEGYWLGWGYPRSTFLYYGPSEYLGDWDNPYLYAKARLSGHPAPFIYFPFAVFATAVATTLPMRLSLVLLVSVFLVALVLMLRGWVVDLQGHAFVRLQHGFILVALSYPVLFVLDRANQEMLVFVFLAGFLYFLYVRKPAWLAVLFLAAAIAYKLYPATFLLLLLAERRVKLCLLTILLAVALTAAGTGFLAVQGGYDVGAIWQMNSQQKSVLQDVMVRNSGGVAHGHTLWGLAQVRGLLLGTGWSKPSDFQMSLYTAGAALIFVLLALHVVFREKERWKQVLLVTAAAILLPFVSIDYTLIHLYFPLLFFVNSPRVSRWNMTYTGLFAVLFIPVDYYYLSVPMADASISVIVYPLALVALVVLAVLDRAPRLGGSA